MKAISAFWTPKNPWKHEGFKPSKYGKKITSEKWRKRRLSMMGIIPLLNQIEGEGSAEVVAFEFAQISSTIISYNQSEICLRWLEEI